MTVWSRIGRRSLASPALSLFGPLCILGLSISSNRLNLLSTREDARRSLEVTRPSTCPDAQWGAPKSLLSLDESTAATVRFPHVTSSGGERFVVGNAIQSFSDTLRSGKLLSVGRVAGTSSNIPEAGKFFIYPRAVLDRLGVLTVVWGEPSEDVALIPPSGWPRVALRSLWSASLSGVGEWTTPIRIYEGFPLWTNRAAERMVLGRDGFRYLVFPTLETSPTLQLIEIGNVQASAVSIPQTQGAVYASLAARGDRFAVAYIASAVEGRLPDRNSVFFIASENRGASWSSPVMVRRSGALAAYDVDVSIDERANISIIWSQTTSSGGRAIAHAYSEDQGQRWSDMQLLSAQDAVSVAPTTAYDRCGQLNVVYREVVDGWRSGRAFHTMWNGVWTRPTMLFPALSVSEPALGSTDDGELFLAFLARPIDASETTPYAALVSSTINLNDKD